MSGAYLRACMPRGLILCCFCSFAAHAQAETLEQAWTRAYQNNPSLEAQRASLRATDEQVSQALSNWRPSIDANGAIGKTSIRAEPRTFRKS